MKKLFLSIALLTFVFAICRDDKKTFEEFKQLEGKWIGILNLSDGSSYLINLNYS